MTWFVNSTSLVTPGSTYEPNGSTTLEKLARIIKRWNQQYGSENHCIKELPLRSALKASSFPSRPTWCRLGILTKRPDELRWSIELNQLKLQNSMEPWIINTNPNPEPHSFNYNPSLLKLFTPATPRNWTNYAVIQNPCSCFDSSRPKPVAEQVNYPENCQTARRVNF